MPRCKLNSQDASQVYFARRHDGLVKIGSTKSLKTRIANLEKSHGSLEVLRVINGGHSRERAIHREFKEYSEYGEWFRDGPGFRVQMEALEAGVTVVPSSSDERAIWGQKELAVAKQGSENLRELIRTVRIKIDEQEGAFRYLAEHHGLPYWPMKHLECGRAITVSAALFQEIENAMHNEIEALAARVRAAKGRSDA